MAYTELEKNHSHQLESEDELFQDLVNKVRQWDRFEHNWQINKRMDIKNLTTQTTFINELKKQFTIKRKA